MFLHKDINGGKGVVIHQGGEAVRGALDDDVLVDFVVAARSIDVGDLFVTSKSVAKQAKVPVGKIRVFKPFAHKHEAPVDPVTVHCVLGIGDDGAKLGFGLGGEHFVGIENENPIMTEGEVFERPIFFLGPGAVEFKLHDLGAVGLSDLD